MNFHLTLFLIEYIVLFTVANDSTVFETQREGNKDRLIDSRNVKISAGLNNKTDRIRLVSEIP